VQKKLATPAKPAIAEPLKPSSSLETPKSQLATPAQCLPPPAPPVKPKATFTRPTLDTTASTSRLNLNEPVIHDHLDVRSSPSSAGATISKEARESFQRKESSMFKAPRPVEKNIVQIEASASQSGGKPFHLNCLLLRSRTLIAFHLIGFSNSSSVRSSSTS